MMDNLIYTRSLLPPPVDRREVLRYAGVRETTAEIEALLDECIAEAEDVLTYKACFRAYDISVEAEKIDLGFAFVRSRSLEKCLCDCSSAVVFCATVGVGIDRIIAKYNRLSPAKAVLLQALGSERVEALCDALCGEIASSVADEGLECTRRFSPGYGDLPLDLQREIFTSLECTRRIGVTIGDNLFMTPTKSVTAIFGMKCK